mgnify:CR=1 FL=1
MYIDRDKNGTINAQDKYRFHKPAADVFYGFNTSVTYKNWDMAMNWRGSWGNFNYNNVDSSKGSYQNILIRSTDLSNGVQNILETGFTTQDTKRYESDYYIQDASFVRLDNVSIGYTFNQKPDSTSLVKLTLAAQNVLLITDYSGLDPEISGGIEMVKSQTSNQFYATTKKAFISSTFAAVTLNVFLDPPLTAGFKIDLSVLKLSKYCCRLISSPLVKNILGVTFNPAFSISCR